MKTNYIKFFLSLIALFFTGNFLAQENTLSSGQEITGSGGTVSQSIGQTVYTTVSSSSIIISQGLQQTYLTVEETSLVEAGSAAKMMVYPNPTFEFVVLNIEDVNAGSYQFALIDDMGKQISEKEIHQNESTIDMRNYANGKYVLNIISNQTIIKSFKIVKTQ